jgi:hypothetical protein
MEQGCEHEAAAGAQFTRFTGTKSTNTFAEGEVQVLTLIALLVQKYKY